MNKIVKMLPAMGFVIAAALVALTSAFKEAPKNVNGTQTSYKWFQISGTYAPSDQVTPADATYLGEGVTPPSGTGCGGATYQCVSGFNANQVTGTNQLAGAQHPATVASEKD